MSAPLLCACCSRIDMGRWLLDRGVRAQPALADALNGLLHPDADVTCIADLGMPVSTARFQMRKKGLPTPARWVQLARSLAIAREMQANPGHSLARVAYRLGYSDHTAVFHALRRTLGITSTEARSPEWTMDALLELWWERVQARKLVLA